MAISTSERMLLRTVVVLGLLLMLWGGRALLSSQAPLTTPAFSYWEVQGVEMHDKAGTLSLVRDNKDWRIGAGDGPLADERRVHALIARWTLGLNTARSVGVEGMEGGEDALGFGDNSRRLVLFRANQRSIIDLDFGRRRAGGDVYLREHGTDLVSTAILLPGPSTSSRPDDWLDGSTTTEE